MRKVREVLGLKRESGLSNRAIARSSSISPITVIEVIRREKGAGLHWPLLRGSMKTSSTICSSRLLPIPFLPDQSESSLPCDWLMTMSEAKV